MHRPELDRVVDVMDSHCLWHLSTCLPLDLLGIDEVGTGTAEVGTGELGIHEVGLVKFWNLLTFTPPLIPFR